MSRITREEMKYEIVSKDESRASIVVRYYVPGYDMDAHLNIDLPIDPISHAIPTGQDLQELLLFWAPIGQLQDQIDRFKQAALVDMSEIGSIISSTQAST